MNATHDDAPGDPGRRITLGRYDLIARLGQGGMADVYLAVARGLAGFQKLSVLKVLRPHVAQDEEFFKMFLDEARLSANFSHPNVVHTHGVEEDGALHFLVMEYLEGRSLAQLEAEQRDLPLPLRLRALADVLHGLHYAHELTDLAGQSYNVVHRDVSPQNVFVTYGGRAKILDFGVAKARNALAQTREGTYKGKVRYMAPEQFMGEPLDRRADIFSAGILLWRALTGRRLWEGLDQLAIMHRLASREPVPAPSSLRPDVPPALDEACRRALSIKPDGRFPNASEFAAVLEEHLASCGVEGSHRGAGRFLEERYAAERASFRGVVDERLRALRDAPVSVPLARGSAGPPSVRNEPASAWVGPASVRALPLDGARVPLLGEESGASGLTPPRLFDAGELPTLRPHPSAPELALAERPSPPPPAPSAAPSAAPAAPPPAPSAAPPRKPGASLGLVLGSLLVIAAAGIAPWWPRLWPQLQAAFAKGAPPGPTHAPKPRAPSVPRLAAPPAPSATTPSAVAPPAPSPPAPASATAPPTGAPPTPTGAGEAPRHGERHRRGALRAP